MLTQAVATVEPPPAISPGIEADAANAAGPRHVLDAGAGISPCRKGPGFSYPDAKGAVVRNKALLVRSP